MACHARLPALLLLSGMFPLLLGSCGGKPLPKSKPAPPIKEKPWKSLVDGARVLKMTRELCALGPRNAGSEGAKGARSWIEKMLRQAGYDWKDLKRQTFTAKTPDPTTEGDKVPPDPILKNDTHFVNLIAVLPGKRKQGLALAAHYDTKICPFPFVGANDAAGAVCGLIELARILKQRARTSPPEFSTTFIFFDGEEAFRWQWQDPDNRYGSRHFVEEMKKKGAKFPFPITGLVLLDMIGSKNIVFADETNSDPGLRRIFKETAQKLFGYAPFQVPQGKTIVDDHASFRGTRVRTMDLIDVSFSDPARYPIPWWHTDRDIPQLLDQRSLEKALTLVLAALPKLAASCNPH